MQYENQYQTPTIQRQYVIQQPNQQVIVVQEPQYPVQPVETQTLIEYKFIPLTCQDMCLKCMAPDIKCCHGLVGCQTCFCGIGLMDSCCCIDRRKERLSMMITTPCLYGLISSLVVGSKIVCNN